MLIKLGVYGKRKRPVFYNLPPPAGRNPPTLRCPARQASEQNPEAAGEVESYGVSGVIGFGGILAGDVP